AWAGIFLLASGRSRGKKKGLTRRLRPFVLQLSLNYCGGCVDVGFSCFSPALSLSLQLLETISTLVTLNSCPALVFISVELVEVEPAEAAVPAFSPEALAAMLFWKAP